MNRLSPEKITEIRDSVDIVDVISSYVSLEPKGKNFFGVCPFHDDNNPSMSVSREKKIYKCSLSNLAISITSLKNSTRNSKIF